MNYAEIMISLTIINYMIGSGYKIEVKDFLKFCKTYDVQKCFYFRNYFYLLVK